MKISVRQAARPVAAVLLLAAIVSCGREGNLAVDIALDGPTEFRVSTEPAGTVERSPGEESHVALAMTIRSREKIEPGGGFRIEQGRLFNGRPLIGTDMRYALGDPVLGPPDAADLVTVETESSRFELTLHPAGLGRHSPQIVFPRGLSAGEKVTVRLGDTRTGGPGVTVPPVPLKVRLLCFADRTGDGNFLLAEGDHPLLESHAVEADRLRVVAPSLIEPGKARVRIVPVRGGRNRTSSSLPVEDFVGEVTVRLSSDPGSPELGRFVFRPGQSSGDVEIVIDEPGLYRLWAGSRSEAVSGTSNPVLVTGGRNAFWPDEYSIRWGSIQSHTAVGGHAAGLQTEAYEIARGPACLDFCSVSDHSSARSFRWKELRGIPDQFNRPGRFVTFAGYEWTSEAHGHRHVILKNAEGSRAWSESPTDDPDTGHAPTLADLADRIGMDPNVLIAVHHTTWLREPAVLDYDFGLDLPRNLPLDRQRLFEIYSWHGSAEFNRSSLPIHGDPARERRPGSSFRDVLAAGARFFITSDSDGHVGMPGIPVAIRRKKGLRYGFSGVTAVSTRSFDREGIFSALEKGRCYGTTGARMLVAFRIGGARPGETATIDGQPRVELAVHGTDVIDSVQLLRDGNLLVAERRPGRLDFTDEFTLSAEPTTGRHSYYLRVEQRDGERAWVTPVWIEWEE